MSTIPTHVLNDGTSLPAIGFGTYPLRGAAGVRAIEDALDVGYRLIDTAVNYENEDAVGEALSRSGLVREDVQITTKLPGRHHGYDATIESAEASRKRLGIDHIDLYLIHWPNPSVDHFVESWRAMIDLQRDGHVTSIGVSNFTTSFLTRLGDETGVLPAVNQIELHPYFPQEELVQFHRDNGIVTESWSPLGKAAAPYNEPVITELAATHGVTPAQIVLRWHVERGLIPIPKSSSSERQRENLDVFGFTLSVDDVARITGLGRADGRLFGGDPNTHEEQ